MNKHADDKRQAESLLRQIDSLCTQPLTLMEVCGTHTMSIAQYGLRALLPGRIRLISGPGCPVCVTDAGVTSAALALAAQPGVVLASFGDMLRVPAGRDSLLLARDRGADVRLVLSPLEALAMAEQEQQRQVVFLAVGFETTAPLTAATVRLATERGVANFSIIPAHKTMPPALTALLRHSPHIDGLLCPGHVAAMTGAEAFRFVPAQLGKSAAVAGFGAADILLAVRALVQQHEQGRAELVNCYPRAVKPGGNPLALAVMDEVFAPTDAMWRGLGLIPGSGLGLRPRYADLDATARFAAAIAAAPRYRDDPACQCGSVLRGEKTPADCPLFGRVCQPEQPAGACMVSSEGSCAAAWRYRELKGRLDDV